jgi:hypothetical protein
MNLKRNTNLNKLIFSFFFFLFSFFPFFAPATHAWTAIPAAILKQTWEKLDFTINGIIMTTLKQAGMRTVMQQYSKIVGGSMGSGARFITNWQSYLIIDPQQQANAIVNAKIDQALRGRGSYYGYIPNSYGYGSVLGASDSKNNEGFAGGKVLGDSFESILGKAENPSSDYYEGMLYVAKKASTEKEEPQMTYEGDPSRMLSGNTFKNANQITYGLNNGWGQDIYWRNEQWKNEQQQTMISQTQSIANNAYLSTMKNGMVITPGSLISQTMANVQNIGNEIMAAATHPEEVISSVLANFITQATVMGIGAVSSVVDRQVNQVTDKALNQMNSQTRTSGPGAMYNRR